MHYEKTIRRIIAAVFVLICIAGIATSIGMNLVNRSLWLDEAALSYSFGKRSLLNLWDGQFEVNQIAPLGWLYCVKVITVFFGNTEFTLRIASVLFYALTIAALYYYVHHSLGCTGLTALAGAALYAGLPFILKYSNVFKPYIADGFFVLLVLIVFAAYRAKQIRMWQLCLIWCVLIWFSNPVVFVQAGCLLTELVSAVKRKDKGAFARLTAVGVIILFCFVVYYFFWLRSVAVGQEMQGYWEGDSFPLIPRSGNDLKRMIHSVLILFSGFSRDKWAMMIVSAAAGVHAIWKKKKEQLYVILATLTALAASSAHFFPISDRLWLFFIPLIAVFCMTGLEEYSVLAGERKLLKYWTKK